MSSAAGNDHSTNSTPPAKPYPGYPLYAHACGQWAKRIRGRVHYFGVWADHQAALTNYLRDKDDLEAGRRPQPRKGNTVLTVQQMVWGFLADRRLKVEAGEMEETSWKDYERHGNRMIKVFGPHTPVEDLTPEDFQRYRAALQKTHKSLSSLKSDLTRAKTFFNWAGPGSNGQGYIDRLPRFGSAMKPPTRAALLRERQERGTRVLSAEQIRALLSAAEEKHEGGAKLKAMILLGINCAFGNTDCAKLTRGTVDLDAGWATFPRPKTGQPRRNPLWPETVAALRAVLAGRKPPRDPAAAHRIFVTKFGQPFTPSAIGLEFEKLAEKVGMSRQEADFYDLRRTCISVGLQARDRDAVRAISGHQQRTDDMLGVYDWMPVSDDRLRRVTDHVRAWLRPAPAVRILEAGDDARPAAPATGKRRRPAAG